MSNTEEMRPECPPPVLLTPQTTMKNEEVKSEPLVPSETEPAKEYAFANRPGDPEIVPSSGKPNLLDAEGKEIKEISLEEITGVEVNQPSVEENEKPFAFGFLSWIGSFFLVLLVLWLFSMSSPFLANALTLQGWRFWVSLGCGVLPIVFVLCLVIYAYRQFRSLSSIEQFQKSAFADKPADLRQKLLNDYLRQLPEPAVYAKENGFPEEEVKSLTDCLTRLTDETNEQFSDSNGWLSDFSAFQELQEAQAKRIVWHACKLVGIQTAASPWKIVDMLAVAYNSTLMVVRLAKLYNRKLSNQKAFRLVCRWSIGIYLSGELGNAAESAVEWTVASNWLSTAYKPLAQYLGKVAEGGANALQVFRLGRIARKNLQPLQDK